MNEITTVSDLEQLDSLFVGSHERPVWVFKHSLVCGISRRAWDEYREFVESTGSESVDYTVVEIQNARPVSAAVAERTGVRHESPQALLILDGRVVWNASHSSITARSLAEATARV